MLKHKLKLRPKRKLKPRLRRTLRHRLMLTPKHKHKCSSIWHDIARAI
jgi:hypothetical protein